MHYCGKPQYFIVPFFIKILLYLFGSGNLHLLLTYDDNSTLESVFIEREFKSTDNKKLSRAISELLLAQIEHTILNHRKLMMKKSTIALGVVVAIAGIGYSTYKTVFSATAVEVSSSELESKFAKYANAERFIAPKELNTLMENDEDVVVIGALNPMKPDQPIAGSFSMWRSDYSAKPDEYEFGGMSNTTEEMEAILGSYGATSDSTIVLYAANAHHDAARLYWQIKSLGHEDVRYLDGGLNAWIGSGYDVGTAIPDVEKTTYISQVPHPSLLATFDMVVEAQSSDEWVIIDTRSIDEFDGATTTQGAFGPGTIAGSVHINWTEALNSDTTLKSAEELKAIYSDVIKDKKVITYCQSGVRSAHTQLVLEEVLGAEEVYNYDGSWIEYSYEAYTSNNENAKVINGTI